MPIFQEYEDAGEFTPKKKFKRSLKNNLIFYAVLGVFGIAFIGYLKYKSNMNE